MGSGVECLQLHTHINEDAYAYGKVWIEMTARALAHILGDPVLVWGSCFRWRGPCGSHFGAVLLDKGA